MALCFLSAFKENSLTSSSSDGSPWILTSILKKFFDSLLMKENGNGFFCLNLRRSESKRTQKRNIFKGIKIQDFKDSRVKIASKLPVGRSCFFFQFHLTPNRYS